MIRYIHCDSCNALMYTFDTDSLNVQHDDDAQTTPVQLIAGGIQRLLFCCKQCAVRWLEREPESNLKNGFPVL